ncbi:hypothetical protein MTR_7g083065 [Medicago truncatula]|uniref:Uncharacterized protein n=1 Tax=Medicago truncatula TaxID=3880 RepID=A0A072U239_MEDTR|nr:hypothetical protein MTR_7g083065 [Medicago truncatula]
MSKTRNGEGRILEKKKEAKGRNRGHWDERVMEHYSNKNKTNEFESDVLIEVLSDEAI